MEKEKSPVRDFTDLLAWQTANKIRLLSYNLAGNLPREEKYNLCFQLKRSLAFIASNIAEGYGRYSYQENTQFCGQARGSLDETRNHLIFIQSVYPKFEKTSQELIKLCTECRKILNGYIKYLQGKKSDDAS